MSIYYCQITVHTITAATVPLILHKNSAQIISELLSSLDRGAIDISSCSTANTFFIRLYLDVAALKLAFGFVSRRVRSHTSHLYLGIVVIMTLK